jgi:hypothetical protein
MVLIWLTFVLASALLILYFLADEGHLSWRFVGRTASAFGVVMTVLVIASLP